MRIISLFRGWPSRRNRVDRAVASDADALMGIWGEAAHAVAADLSWRESSGLMHASDPGHWARVGQEIGRRLGLDDTVAFPPHRRRAA